MGVFFLLIAVVVQLGFLVIARSAISASMEASARRASLPDAVAAAEEGRLAAEIRAVVPGIELISADVERSAEEATVTATFDWTPPGPDLIPVRFTLVRAHASVVPP